MQLVDLREKGANRFVLPKGEKIGNDASEAVIDALNEHTLVFRQFVQELVVVPLLSLTLALLEKGELHV
jgi:hypothetical protein